MIDEVNSGRTRSNGFKNKRLAELKKEIKDKEKEIRKNKRSKVKEEKDKVIFNYRATDDTPFYFSDDTKLLSFAENLYKEDLSFDEAKEDQEEMLKKINELKKRIKPQTGPGSKKSNKEKLENLANNAEDLYILKNKIIKIIEKEMGYSSKSDVKTEDKNVDLSWLK